MSTEHTDPREEDRDAVASRENEATHDPANHDAVTNHEGDNTDANAREDIDTEEAIEGLPPFMQKFERTDWILWWVFVATGIYGLALIPFRAVLLLNHTFAYTVLTGSNLSVLSLAAQNPHRPLFLAITTVVAALSMVKFLPLFYLIGKRWGPEFIDMLFGEKPPLWFRKLENFIYKRIGFCLFLSYVPFSPIPATVIVVIAAVKKVKGWIIAALVFVFALMLKCFYLYLGLRFGEEVRATLQVIDKYVMWITIALVIYAIFSSSVKKKATPGTRRV